MSIGFDFPWIAVVAALLPLGTVALFTMAQRRRMQRLARLGGPAALERLAPVEARRSPLWRTARVATAVSLIALGVAGPRWGMGTAIVRTEGVDVVLAIDASLSMLATDELPSRLERLKREVRVFRAAAPGNRVALLAFAGRSYILSPLTNDDGAVDLFLDNLDPSVVGQPGTALAPTITQGVDLLRAARGSAGRALVIMSDGEAFDDKAASLAAARAAKDNEIAIVTVGFGTEAGGQIPLADGSAVVPKRDEAGQIVITRYDPAMLRDIAAAAQGEFIPAGTSDRGTRIQQALRRLDSQQRDVQEGRSRPLHLVLFLFPALLLLLLDAWRADGGTFALARRWFRFVAPVALLALLTLLVPQVVVAQSDPMDHFKAGRFVQAARAWKQKIAEGDKRPATLYNLGTALLAADSINSSIDALERAASAPDASVRQRALYNLGLAHLRRAQRGGADVDAVREANVAAAAYRTLLLQRNDDADARWNYELALRVRQQNGGGGSSNKDNQQPQQQRSRPEERQGMSRQQAEQLLAAAQRDEKESQAKRQRGTRQERAPGGKDW